MSSGEIENMLKTELVIFICSLLYAACIYDKAKSNEWVARLFGCLILQFCVALPLLIICLIWSH